MAILGTSWIYLAAWIRRWLYARLYPGKKPKPHERAIVFALHLVILAAMLSLIIGGFLGAVRLTYGYWPA